MATAWTSEDKDKKKISRKNDYTVWVEEFGLFSKDEGKQEKKDSEICKILLQRKRPVTKY